MTKKITTVVPDAIYEDFAAWAKEEGRALSNLTAFILDQALRAKYPKKYPSPIENK